MSNSESLEESDIEREPGMKTTYASEWRHTCVIHHILSDFGFCFSISIVFMNEDNVFGTALLLTVILWKRFFSTLAPL